MVMLSWRNSPAAIQVLSGSSAHFSSPLFITLGRKVEIWVWLVAWQAARRKRFISAIKHSNPADSRGIGKGFNQG